MTILNKKIIINEDIVDKCHQFAQASISSNSEKYARRNQLDIGKILKDIKNGKIGEEIVYQQLLSIFPNLSEPDHKIYESFNKSWDPDLKDDNSKIRIAVKSQDIESAINFGESWVFQFNYNKNYDCDTGIFKENDPNHYVSFVSLNVPKRVAFIRAIVKVGWLHKKSLFKDMKKENLRGNKLAVYYEDLLNYSDELFQLY